MVKLSLLAFALVAVSAAVNGAVILRRDGAAPKDNLSVSVESEQVFCTFLPSKPGQEIGASEGEAVPFCTQATPNAPGAQLFPQGYIVSAHFVNTSSYVQVTGVMNPTAAGLNPNDSGGQYDSVGAPPDAVCTGYNKFVNLVEPTDKRYCIRCCMDDKDCNTGDSTAGCPAIIPGDYS